VCSSFMTFHQSRYQLDVLTFDTVLHIDNVRVAYYTHLFLLLEIIVFVVA